MRTRDTYPLMKARRFERMTSPNVRLTQLRVASGLPASRIEETCGLWYGGLHRIETGECVPHTLTAAHIAKFFNTTMDDLFGYLADEELAP